MVFVHSSAHWTIDSLTHRSCVSSLIHRLIINSLIHRLGDSLIHWFTDWSNHWFTDSLTHWVTESLMLWFMDSLIHSFIASLLDWFIGSFVNSVSCAWIHVMSLAYEPPSAHALMHLTTSTVHCFCQKLSIDRWFLRTTSYVRTSAPAPAGHYLAEWYMVYDGIASSEGLHCICPMLHSTPHVTFHDFPDRSAQGTCNVVPVGGAHHCACASASGAPAPPVEVVSCFSREVL